jgi:addiction module HigA family antidote
MDVRLDNIHPGEVLLEEFLRPLNMSQYRLAKELRVPVTRIAAIVKGRREVSPDTALRLATLFGTTPDFWLNLQASYALEEVRKNIEAELLMIKPLPQNP